MNGLLNWFMDWLKGLPDWLIVFIVSMVPLIELRGGMVAAALLKMSLGRGILFSMLGNLFVVPLILLFILPIFDLLRKTKLFRPLVEKLEARSLEKSEKIQKYKFWGLVLFVGIPLPGTGAWSGGLIAALLDMKIRQALPAICLGLVMAETIMCLITYGIPALIQWLQTL